MMDPFRNGIFLALAAAWAEARGVRDLVCGFHVADSPDYPDTTARFVRAMERGVRAGTKAAFGGPRPRVLAPFVGLDKTDIIREGLRLGADYSRSVSCYAGEERPCGSVRPAGSGPGPGRPSAAKTPFSYACERKENDELDS